MVSSYILHIQDFLPGDEELPSARSQRPVRRSRSNSADRIVAAVPGGAEPSWAPSEQLRSRAQRHQQQVHAATKEAMVAEEEPHRALENVGKKSETHGEKR